MRKITSKGKTVSFFVFALFFLVAEGNAQEQSYTYKEAVTRALEKSIALDIQKNEMDAVRIDKDQSRAQFAPSVNAFMQYRRQNGNIFIPQQLELINTTTDDFFPQIEANLILFNGMRNVNNARRANHLFEAQQHRIKNTNQLIISEVTNHYMNVLLAQEVVKIADENIEAQKTLLKRIKSFVDEGIIFIGDQYNQEAEIKSLELAKVQAINTFQNRKAVLSRYLLLEPPAQVKVIEPDWSLEAQMISDYKVEELYQTAVANRQDLKRLLSVERANHYNVSMAKSNFLPTVSAFFSYNTYYNNSAEQPIFNESGDVIGSEKISFLEQTRDNNPNKSIGVRINIPIFNRFQNKSTLAQRKLSYENSRLEIESLKNTIYTQVLTALQDYEAAVASYEASVARFNATELAMNTQRERYKLGNATIEDLTLATNNHISASVDKASARYTLLFQKIIIDYQTGVISFETLPGK